MNPTLLSARPAVQQSGAPQAPAAPRRGRQVVTEVPSAAWCRLFGVEALGAAALAQLNSAAFTRVVAEHTLVFARTQCVRAAHFLLDGDVALGVRDASGGFRTERIAHGVHWLDLSSLWLGGTHALDAVATSTAQVGELPLDRLHALARAHPDIGARVITLLAGEVRDLTLQQHELMHKDAAARVAAWLDQHCAPGEGPVTIRLHERKRDIASQLAITPETFSRMMGSLIRKGVIAVAGYNVAVLDRGALTEIAAGETAQL